MAFLIVWIKLVVVTSTKLIWWSWIQNVVDPRQNDVIMKVFELAESSFHSDMERDCRIWALLSYCDRSRNRDQNCILYP